MRGFAGQRDNSPEEPHPQNYQNRKTGSEQPKFDIGGEYIPFEEIKDR